jgi:two-component system copper resistance phosphate regulon response regulator CusR
MRVLIVEADPALSEFLRRGLESEGLRSEVVYAAADAQVAIEQFTFHLLVVGLGAEVDDVQLVSWVREHQYELPVFVLTARNRVEDRVALLNAGADDCLMKPFSFHEFMARVRALLRRSSPATHVLRCGDLELNRVERQVHRAGKFIELTTKEFGLLEYLMLNAGRTVSRSMILEDVWRMHFQTITNVVDVYINYLRKKVDQGCEQKLIRTVRGAGYQIGEPILPSASLKHAGVISQAV